ncbi:hypothetical protein ES288_A13G089700v1 [Gossypium darwinii]|uniref:Cytochrome P450 n=1 Tax=Gossypium darwinii TaxID=34276 RepID=A0A5D2DXZ2_GOSDA|nr:hypothetical protein ES288_A13G089700v1 [Gossypium darwinii]
MDTMGKLLIIFTFSLCLYLLVALLYVFYRYWWIPYRIQLIMNSQGIRGPPYKFIHGNNKETAAMRREAFSKPMALTHAIFPRVMPHVYSWINKYDPEIVKEVLRNSEKAFPKGKPTSFFEKILGEGLVTTESEKWARQRKLANYAFHGESLKNMIPAVVVSVETMLEKWKGREGKEMEVFQEFKLLTSEVISRTAFSSSYLEGEKIFEMLTKLSLIASRNVFKTRLPIISRFWKSSDEIESDKLAKMIHDSVMKIVEKREEKVNNRLSIQDLVDECKTFYFAGQETTNSLLARTILLLAVHTDWQEKARREVIEIIGKGNPNSEGIAKLKTIPMIMNETLRLYPPATGTMRKVEREVRLGKLVLPTDLELNIRIMALHHDPDLWGDDVHLFKPERFAEGISKATNYNAAAFFPFGLGPRSCVGMSFAITETKIALSMILQRYTFTLSPAYVHSPLPLITLKPQHGIQLLFHSLHDDA